MPASSSPPKGGLVRITSTRSLSPISREPEAQAVAGVDLGRFEPVQQQVHLAEQVGKRLGLAAVEAVVLEDLAVADGLALLFQVVVGLDEEAAGAAGRVEHGLAELRVDHLDHEAGRPGAACRTRRCRRRRRASRGASFVEVAEGVDLLAAR